MLTKTSMAPWIRLVTLVFVATGCGVQPAQRSVATDGPPANLAAAADSLYQEYARVLRTGDRGRIAQFYAPRGAQRVLNGHSRRLTQAAIDSLYRYRWSPPAFFAWDSLQFETLPPSRVLVVGRFRWQGTGQADTGSYAYAALLEAVDSGLAIFFEHETSLAPSGR